MHSTFKFLNSQDIGSGWTCDQQTDNYGLSRLVFKTSSLEKCEASLPGQSPEVMPFSVFLQVLKTNFKCQPPETLREKLQLLS